MGEAQWFRVRPMTLGAILIPIVALAVCFGGMWFAWRLVMGAEREGAGPKDQPTAAADAERPPPPAPARRGVAGPVIALAAVMVGLGGFAFIAAPALGSASPLLVAGGVATGVGLLGGFSIWALRRRPQSLPLERPAAHGEGQ